jgi:hypothetical protein
MGASYETTYVKTTKGHTEAYSIADSDAYAQYGSDSYNGSITTTQGVTLLKGTALPRKVAERFANSESVVRSLQKWGPAGAILVATDESFTRRKKKLRHETKQVEYRTIIEDIFQTAALAAGPGEHVESVTIVVDKPKWRTRNERVVVKPQICYEVRVSGRAMRDGVFEKKTDAITKAREVSKLWLQEGRGRQLVDKSGQPTWESPATVTVHAVVKTGETDQICDFSPELVQRVVTAEVVYAKAKNTVQNDGWLFCFWAAC